MIKLSYYVKGTNKLADCEQIDVDICTILKRPVDQTHFYRSWPDILSTAFYLYTSWDDIKEACENDREMLFIMNHIQRNYDIAIG